MADENENQVDDYSFLNDEPVLTTIAVATVVKPTPLPEVPTPRFKREAPPPPIPEKAEEEHAPEPRKRAYRFIRKWVGGVNNCLLTFYPGETIYDPSIYRAVLEGGGGDALIELSESTRYRSCPACKHQFPID